MIQNLELIQLVSTLFMVGLIWFVQVVHYPLFDLVKDSPHYHRQHQRRTSWVVLPSMTLELSSACSLFYARQTFADQAGLFLLFLIWSSTFLFQVPCHMKLKEKYSAATVHCLVKTNWIRTVSWSLRAFVILLF